jgi:hypothetical protein
MLVQSTTMEPIQIFAFRAEERGFLGADVADITPSLPAAFS